MTAEMKTQKRAMAAAGEAAPDFTLRDQNGNPVRLSDYRGKKVVLFFYPKAYSPGCTAEACQFRDAYEDFTSAGAEVIGISSDDETTQKGFASRFRLQFTLLADRDEQVHRAYGVNRTLGLIKGRATFVIDENGTVIYAFQSHNPATHMASALRALTESR
jgi:thioredoxin-dependent peroxiredoxin